MRLTWPLAALLCLCTGAAPAQTVDLPHLPDGTVDLGKVFPTLKLRRTLSTHGPGSTFTGELLGAAFTADMQGDPAGQGFALQITAPHFSEEAVFVTAVFVTDIACIQIKRRPGPVQWRATARLDTGRWHVATSCKQEPHPPRPAEAK